MFAPQQATVLFRQCRDGVRKRADQCRLLRVFHIKDRPDVQDAGIHMTEHPVFEAVAIEQVAKLGDVVRQILRWHGGVFDKWLGPGFALDIAQ